MSSGKEKGCIPIKYFKEIKNIHTKEQVKFRKHIPVDNKQDKSLSLLAQKFIPVQLTGMLPTNINIQIGREKQTKIAVPELYCGQEYDDKHVWNDLQFKHDEYYDNVSEQNKEINTLQ